MMLEVKNLYKAYPGPDAPISILDNLNLSVGKGDSVAIVGPSGCGKTTLLNILGTLDIPTEGTVTIDGREVGSMDAAGRARFRNRSLGFVFQQHFLLPQCTVIENTLIPRLAGGWDESEDATRERAASLLESVGLSHRIKHMPYQLSGGERLRVAVARALVNQPSLILADEPTGSLDSSMSDQVSDLFSELNETHDVTLVTVTHNLALAKRMKLIYSLENGKLSERQP